MKNIFLLILMSLMMVTACTSSEKKAAELLDTAKFEEKQTNTEHAVKLYKEIVSKYPETSVAKEAEARLKALKQ